jgi:hypothetical protein
MPDKAAEDRARKYWQALAATAGPERAQAQALVINRVQREPAEDDARRERARLSY